MAEFEEDVQRRVRRIFGDTPPPPEAVSIIRERMSEHAKDPDFFGEEELELARHRHLSQLPDPTPPAA